MTNWNLKYIQTLQRDNKIRGYKIPERKKGYSQYRPQVVSREKPKAVAWLDLNLQLWANDNAVTLETEYRIASDRKYRWDYCFPALKICIEYNGGMFMERSGHNSVKGLLRDSDKQNLAVSLGWRPIVLTSLNYQTVLKTLNDLIK